MTLLRTDPRLTALPPEATVEEFNGGFVITYGLLQSFSYDLTHAVAALLSILPHAP